MYFTAEATTKVREVKRFIRGRTTRTEGWAATAVSRVDGFRGRGGSRRGALGEWAASGRATGLGSGERGAASAAGAADAEALGRAGSVSGRLRSGGCRREGCRRLPGSPPPRPSQFSRGGSGPRPPRPLQVQPLRRVWEPGQSCSV